MFTTLVLVALTAAPPSPPAATLAIAPRYYFILFGGQSIPFVPRTAHTWATWVKATPAGDGSVALEAVTISWLPAVGEVDPLKFRRTVGKNHSMAETLEVARANHARVSMWGPFETDAVRYQRAVEQARTLESGTVAYRTIDTLGLDRSVQHCVHAVTFADTRLDSRIQPVLRVGEPGTSRLAARYARTGAFVGGSVTHDWLISPLGLDQGVVRRQPGEHIPRQFR